MNREIAKALVDKYEYFCPDCGNHLTDISDYDYDEYWVCEVCDWSKDSV